MAPPLKFIITISNTEDLAVLAAIDIDPADATFEDSFRHGFRSMFNDPKFVALATDFAEQTRILELEVPTDPDDLTELTHAPQS